MGERDELSAAVLQIHAAGLDAAKWPEALGAVAKLIGGAAATFEVFDPSSVSHRAFYGFNIPHAEEIAYLADYIADNPRWAVLMPRQKSGDIGWDYQFIDERQMDREPFYAKFLAALDMRYFLSGVLTATAEEYAVISVQRGPRQGHAERREIDLMASLVPHVRQALDVSQRLAALSGRLTAFERALDWLADGALVLARDGAVRYANPAAQDIIRGANGLGLRDGAVTFRSTGAAAKLRKAMAAIVRLTSLDVTSVADADFLIERGAGMPPLMISLRPLPPAEAASRAAVALMFVHDILTRGRATTAALREAFGLTPAEADMAASLCAGVSPDAHARARKLSRNTIYTHLRRIKEKTGCARLPELIRKLNDVPAVTVRRKLDAVQPPN